MKIYGLIHKDDENEELYHVVQMADIDDYFFLVKSDSPRLRGNSEKYGILFLTIDKEYLIKFLTKNDYYCGYSVMSPWYDGNKADLKIVEIDYS